MKGWMKKLAAAIAVTLSLFVLTGCPDYEPVELELTSKPTMTVQSFDEETELYTILVEGLAANTSEKTLTSASIRAILYDEVGDPIDCYGDKYISGIDAGETWHYYILMETDVLPTDFKIAFARGH